MQIRYAVFTPILCRTQRFNCAINNTRLQMLFTQTVPGAIYLLATVSPRLDRYITLVKVSDAVKVRMDEGALLECEANPEVLTSDTMDQFRTFQMCERLLHSPTKLGSQLLYQIPAQNQIILIERYYEFDSVFAREVLGKKLSKGTKKDLDDISCKTGITLKSCRRQFDNFKRVFKVVEELKGPLVENIQRHFLLSDTLARDYAAIVFFANSRFETGKRKLQYLSFQDFAFCAGQLISYWTIGAMDSMMEDMDVDLEKEFLNELKDLKVLVNDKDMMDQHKILVCAALRGKIKVYKLMEVNFKNLSRALVNLASKLTHTKDVRDLFIDLVEKFIEPCRYDRWTVAEITLFLTHYTNAAHCLGTFRHQMIWDRYMGVIKSSQCSPLLHLSLIKVNYLSPTPSISSVSPPVNILNELNTFLICKL
ncbi:acidic fibroblast growth factor intracellular-binding protein B isoform X3 [Oncorhynchus mykiss]|uniref:Fibroblast growth factor (acidic) intracellular binding protein b n=1 Tax=Oncorhynchus mykiss TaxID=8022 RepID=A0A8K9WWF1_ONCMY|nr:acidic fibroblast growth factor intracellular-binding protein B isoform X3 [Oncorhynchus mykiss]